jgi:mRNA capping enzyme, beta chain
MQDMYAKFSPIVSNFLKAPHHEIEFRLGKMSRGKFDTNVGVDVYQNVLRGLGSFHGWEEVKRSNDTIYYGNNDRRAIFDNMTEQIVRCVKKRVHVVDHKMDPLDVRLSICTEVPYEPTEDEEEFEHTRNRIRHSFIRKNLSIDVSMVTGTPDDIDDEQSTTYQIEMEIIKPEDVKSEQELYNIVHKILDVMKIT